MSAPSPDRLQVAETTIRHLKAEPERADATIQDRERTIGELVQELATVE